MPARFAAIMWPIRKLVRHGYRVVAYDYSSKLVLKGDVKSFWQLATKYTLQTKNDDPKVVENGNMVELAGTAPASIGLSR